MDVALGDREVWADQCADWGVLAIDRHAGSTGMGIHHSGAHAIHIALIARHIRDQYRPAAESRARRGPQLVSRTLEIRKNRVARRRWSALGAALDERVTTAAAELIHPRHAERQHTVQQHRILHPAQHGGLDRDAAGVGQRVFHDRRRQRRVRGIQWDKNRVAHSSTVSGHEASA